MVVGERPGWRQQFFLSNEQKQRFVACSLYKKSESLNLESFLQDSSKITYIILYPESLLATGDITRCFETSIDIETHSVFMAQTGHGFLR